MSGGMNGSQMSGGSMNGSPMSGDSMNGSPMSPNSSSGFGPTGADNGLGQMEPMSPTDDLDHDALYQLHEMQIEYNKKVEQILGLDSNGEMEAMSRLLRQAFAQQ